MKYRVVVAIGHRKTFFDFASGINALNFASDAKLHHTLNEEDEEAEEDFKVSIDIIINEEAEEEDGEQED